MRAFVQVCCVVAVAIGSGLSSLAWFIHNAAQVAEHDRQTAVLAPTFAIGIFLMTLGWMGLIVSWVNMFLARQRLKDGATLPKEPVKASSASSQAIADHAPR